MQLTDKVKEGDFINWEAAKRFLYPEKLKCLGITVRQIKLYTLTPDGIIFRWELTYPTFKDTHRLGSPKRPDGTPFEYPRFVYSGEFPCGPINYTRPITPTK